MRAHYARKLPTEWLHIAQIFDGLGDPTRQTILLLFEKDEELTTKQLADALPYSRTSIVHHISTLERAELLQRRKEGREVFFRINKDLLINTLERVLTYAKTEV